MNIEELSAIVRLAELRAIGKALKAAGWKDCRRDKALRRASLYDIAVAQNEETPYYTDKKGRQYNGGLYRGVKGHEGYVFAVIQRLAPFKRGGEDLSTDRMLIYAQAVK